MPPELSSDDDLEDYDEEFNEASIDENIYTSDDETTSVGSLEGYRETEARSNGSKWLDFIRPSEFVTPRSQYYEYIPPIPLSAEKEVLKHFLHEKGKQKTLVPQDRPRRVIHTPESENDKDFVEFELSEFSIYLPYTNFAHGGTMTGLQNLANKSGHTELLFDGKLTFGEQNRYVKEVPFKLCSVAQYGQEFDSVGGNIWIQSNLGEICSTFYRLKSPSADYRRYHKGFLWLADLGKHFVDYISKDDTGKRDVSIHDFKTDFHAWLKKIHKNSKALRDWMKQFNGRDFRGHIAANVEYLYKETNGTYPELRELQIWKEIRDLNFIPMQDIHEKRTVVTPYVYDCFSHLKFGNQLIMVSPTSDVQKRQKKVGQNLKIITTKQNVSRIEMGSEDTRINVGDVVAVAKDDIDIAEWKTEPNKWRNTTKNWFALVQKVNVKKKGQRHFDIIWLYSPSDTTCAKMKYPHSRELFLSDNCSCSTRTIPEGDVQLKVSVTWNGSPETSKTRFFIRQAYLMDNRFVTLQDIHKQCVHVRGDTESALREFIKTYKVGDTVLFIPPSHLNSKHQLETGEIEEYVEDSQELVVVRRLYRLLDHEHGKDTKANELVYTNDLLKIPMESVQRKCFVRLYTEEDISDQRIPPPYSRDGTGNAFYITKRLVGQALEPIQLFPRSLIQGPDFEMRPRPERLRGLDLYCGGGNFGRGLEEGGGVHNTHAVDLNRTAIHTYFANLKDPKSTKLYFGSVNDLLAEALRGNPSKSALVPLPGDIDFISAGSPCPGFSHLNNLRDGAKGLKDQSLVASVAAFIDLYRPKYALLENVVSMAQKGPKRDEDVLSQLICCIVGMGYQVQVFNLDAWSVGSPQSRGRLFVSIAAPGLEPPTAPVLSHSHPAKCKRRGLGLMANGLSFGERRFERTPFEYITAGAATKDLPDIGDGRTFHCSWHSDHRMSRSVDHKLKAQIESIPLTPKGMNYAKAAYRMVPSDLALFPTLTKAGHQRQNTMSNSKAYGRVNPHKVFPPVATTIAPSCSRTGTALHWDQQRLLTVLEARRAQSFPDEEVIIGSVASQWRIVGNSVPRTAALALGLSICEAWAKSYKDLAQTGVNCDAKVHLDDTNKTIDLSRQNLSPSFAIKPLPTREESIPMELLVLRSPKKEGNSSKPFNTGGKKRQRKSSTSETPCQPRIDKRRFLESTSQRYRSPAQEFMGVRDDHDRRASPQLNERSNLTSVPQKPRVIEDKGPPKVDPMAVHDLNEPPSPPGF